LGTRDQQNEQTWRDVPPHLAAQVAGEVAHDFNNLLTIIIGYTDLVRRRAGDDEDTAALCQTVLSAARQASDLTAKLLAVSRPHADGLPAEPRFTPDRPDGDARPDKPLILLVDDDAAIRELSREILEPEGYCLVQAAGADEALEALGRLGSDVDLLLTDEAMPGMKGKELVDRARDRRPELPVLFLSGYASGAATASGESGTATAVDGFTAYLGKPFRSRELRSRVRELLELSGARNGIQPLGPS
jgi:CheY-like chemotaxis protein